MLTIDSVADLWSKTYNTHGKPDWEHIFPYYHQDMVFQDSVQRIEGKEEFIEMCNRLTRRCKELEMKILSIAQNDNVILMEWIMTMQFKRNPTSDLHGTTKLVLNEGGMIIEQRDYYDLWGDIFDNIPRFGKAYRRFMKRKFG